MSTAIQASRFARARAAGDRLAERCWRWLYPARCAGCRAGCEEPFCAACLTTIEPIGPACPRCALPYADAAAATPTCARCLQAPLAVAPVLCAWRYGGALADAVVALKFHRRTDVARTIAPIWAPLLGAAARELSCDAIVPVPTHWRRRWQRGFDHTLLLLAHARPLAAATIPVLPVLRHTRAVPQQSRLAAPERQRNVAGSFVVPQRLCPSVGGRRLLLVDDVMTTGATLHAAARALRAAGADAVAAVVIARAEPP